MKLLILIGFALSLSGCATVGGALQAFDEGYKKNQPQTVYQQPQTCNSYVYGNSVSTSCY